MLAVLASIKYHCWERLLTICLFCSTLLVFGIDWFRTLALFKVGLYVEKLKLLEAITIVTKSSILYMAGVLKIQTILSFSSVWLSLIVFYSIMFWLIIIWVFKPGVLTNIFQKKVYLETGFVSTWRVLLVYLPGLLSNWGKLLPSKTLR